MAAHSVLGDTQVRRPRRLLRESLQPSFYIATSSKKRIKTLHLLGSSYMIPGIDYPSFTYAGERFPNRRTFHGVCKWCARDEGAQDPDGHSSDTVTLQARKMLSERPGKQRESGDPLVGSSGRIALCRAVLCVVIVSVEELSVGLRGLSWSETPRLSVGLRVRAVSCWNTCCLVQGDTCGRAFACHPRGSERNLLPFVHAEKRSHLLKFQSISSSPVTRTLRRLRRIYSRIYAVIMASQDFTSSLALTDAQKASLAELEPCFRTPLA